MAGLDLKATSGLFHLAGTQYVNPSHGTRRLCLRTGSNPNDVARYGFTSDISASQYSPICMRMPNGQIGRIGRYQTMSTSASKSVSTTQHSSRTTSYTTNGKHTLTNTTQDPITRTKENNGSYVVPIETPTNTTTIVASKSSKTVTKNDMITHVIVTVTDVTTGMKPAAAGGGTYVVSSRTREEDRTGWHTVTTEGWYDYGATVDTTVMTTYYRTYYDGETITETIGYNSREYTYTEDGRATINTTTGTVINTSSSSSTSERKTTNNFNL